MRSDDGAVQRYAPEGHPCECGMQECDWGEYVKLEDVESHIATLTEQARLREIDCANQATEIATLTAEVERVRGERDGWERRTKYLGSVVSRAWIVLRGWWHYETEERDDEPFVEALERAVAADRAHDAYSLAEAQKWRDATATARADALIEVREEVGGLLRVENFVEGYGIVDTVILEELTEALDALDATRGETTDPAAPAASPSHSAGAPAGAGESHPAARSPADG